MALPPGVYFNPSPEDCVRDYLRPWISSGCDEARTPLHGSVFPVDVYRHSPGELEGMFPPGHARGFDFKWYFVTPRGGFGGRGRRRILTGGNWKVEQKAKDVDLDGELGGGAKRRTFGFYLSDGRKTAWLMEEMATADGEGGEASSSSAPVFCRIYVSPRADNDEKRAILGEEGVAVDGEGRAKPATLAVDEAYFDLLAARLPPFCVRVHAAPPTGVLGHQIQAGQFAAPPPDFPGPHYYSHPAPPPEVQQGEAPPPQHYYVEAEAPPEFLGQNYYPPAPPIHVAPPQGEEETHRAEKKPQLTYASRTDSSTRKIENSELKEESHDAAVLLQEPAAPQEEESPRPGTAPPPPPAAEFDASKQEQQPPKDRSPDGSTDQSNLTRVSCDGELPDFDGFLLRDLLQPNNFDDVSWVDDVVPVQ